VQLVERKGVARMHCLTREKTVEGVFEEAVSARFVAVPVSVSGRCAWNTR